MPPKIDKETVFFLTNIGKQPSNGDPDYVEKAKEVMKLITEKKIFLRPKDLVGIMVVGREDGDSIGSTRCTTLVQPNQVPSWEMVENILDLKKTTNRFNDWPNALTEVLEHLREFVTDSRVILILLFDCDTACPGIDCIHPASIADELKDQGIQLLWIGSKALKDKPMEELSKSERVLMEILKMTNGEYMTIDKTLPSLRIFKKHKARFMAWKCPLEIGNISIPTSTYVQAVDDEKPPAFQTVNTSIKGNVEKGTIVRAERDFVDRHREAHPLSETIPGYMYGRKFIPVPEADEVGMDYSSGTKSFEIYGFVCRDSIKLEDLAGDSSRIVVPDGQFAEKPFYCLVQAMMENEYAAIVRRVYQARSDPKLCALFPRTDVPGEPWCFVLLELLYVEDRRVLQPQPLNSVLSKLTKEKEEVVEDLIDSMMLTDADDKGDDLFAPGTVPSPGLQHLWNSLSYRALNPDAPLPPMDESLKRLLDPPESIKVKSEPVLEKLKELFPIEETKDDSTEAQATTQLPIPLQTEKIESKVEKEEQEPTFRPEESCVDLDELFDADMDM